MAPPLFAILLNAVPFVLPGVVGVQLRLLEMCIRDRLVAQLRVAFAPELMLVGFAAKEVTEGTEPEFDGEFGALVVLPQPARPTQTSKRSTSAQR